LLNVMKIMLLAGLYLFFVRVLWSVFNEIRDPRVLAPRRAAAGPAPANPYAAGPQATMRGPAPSAPVPAGYANTTGGGVAAGRLVVIDPKRKAGTTYAIGGQTTIGRAPTNGIQLDDSYVSSVHARIFLTNGTFFVEDLSSRNGSTLNGAPIVATTALVPGDRLQLGGITLEFS
jgi:hypothetical protein